MLGRSIEPTFLKNGHVKLLYPYFRYKYHFFSYWFIVFYICSKVPCNRDTGCHSWITMSLPENLNQLDLNFLNPFWPEWPVHSQTRNFFITRLLFLLRWWYESSFSSQISFPMCCKTLCTVFSRALCTIQLDMPNISILTLQEHNAFLQHWRSREAACFTRASFTFLKT